MNTNEILEPILIFLATLSGSILIICFVLHRSLFACLRQKKMKKKLERCGVEAGAVLLKMQHTGFYLNDKPQVVLQMQVNPRQGKKFVTETHELLPENNLFQLQSGRPLVVKYNPSNTREVMVLWNGLQGYSY